jgi:RPA family protein
MKTRSDFQTLPAMQELQAISDKFKVLHELKDLENIITRIPEFAEAQKFAENIQIRPYNEVKETLDKLANDAALDAAKSAVLQYEGLNT